MKVAGVPFVQGKHPRSKLTPTAVVVHRTYGKWAGDYAIGLNGRSGQPIGFHFLIGKAEGRWVQFYDTSTICNHAAGANSWAIGIEFEGRNEEPLTDWQIRAARWIITACCNAHNIPKTYTNTGARRRVAGVLPHSLVPGSTHTDYLTRADWDRIMPPVLPVLPTRTAVTYGQSGRLVEIMQWELAVVTGRGPEITLDGKVYGLRTTHVLQDLSRILSRPDWGNCTTVTPAMWQAIDFLYLAQGHQPILP